MSKIEEEVLEENGQKESPLKQNRTLFLCQEIFLVVL